MAVGCIFSLLIALIFIDTPLDFALVFALIVFLEFLAIVAGIFLITTSFVPLMALSSLELAYALVHDLIVGSILAVLLTFLVHLPIRSGHIHRWHQCLLSARSGLRPTSSRTHG
jgi:uncharacterized membrane protein YccC